MQPIYKFRHRTSISVSRLRLFDFAVAEAYAQEDFPPELRDMLAQYERSDVGATSTLDKRKADIFITFLSTLEGWGPGKPPMKWKVIK